MNYEQLIEGIGTEILEQEPVYAGYRPLKLKYTTSEGVVIKKITYTHPADSAGWKEIKEVTYEQ